MLLVLIPLLRNAPGTVWLLHCEAHLDRITAEVVIAEAGTEDDWQLVDGPGPDGPLQFDLQLPPQLVANGVRVKAYQTSHPLRPL